MAEYRTVLRREGCLCDRGHGISREMSRRKAHSKHPGHRTSFDTGPTEEGERSEGEAGDAAEFKGQLQNVAPYRFNSLVPTLQVHFPVAR